MLDGRVAIVTGAARGLGREFVRVLAAGSAEANALMSDLPQWWYIEAERADRQ